MIYFKSIDTCFVRVPKTGSESLHLFLYKNFYNHSEDLISKIPEIKDYGLYDQFQLQPNEKWNFESSHVTAKELIEADLVPSSAAFIGVIRNPLERFLSLYTYYIKKGRYYTCTVPSPEHFQTLFDKGVFKTYTSYHVRPQYEFLEYNNQTGSWWLYDNLEDHIKLFCDEHALKIKYDLTHINKSPGNKKKLIKHFYTKELILDIEKMYEKDFELYDQLEKQYNVK